VRADNPPLWGDKPVLIEEVRIGMLEGGPEFTFGDITGFVVDSDGVMWVADALAATIRRFRSNGSYLGDVGRKGEGPGEFNGGYGIGLARAPDGRIVSYDPLRFGGTWSGALAVFSAQGDYVGGLPLRLRGISGGAFQLRADTSGVLYLNNSRTVRQGTLQSSGLITGGARQRIWLRMDLHGNMLDTLDVPSANSVSSGGKGYSFGFMPAYTPRTMSALSPHGYLVTGRSDLYALSRPLRDGRTVRIERTWDPVRARDDERAQFQRQLENSARNSGRTPQNTVEIPREKPPFWALQVDDDGRIWVARHQEGYHRAETPEERAHREAPTGLPVPAPVALEWWEPLVTDVIEPSGRYLGTIRWPNNRATIAATRGDTIWAIERGDLDEQYVVRYRIQHP
jgi:hypothetical protein